MNYIWGGLILISIIFGTINGRLNEVINAMLVSVQSAVSIVIALIGIMAFWLGMAKIAQDSGLIERFSKLISPVLRLIFNELPKNSPAFSNIALNFSANALGLSNAATPFGIKAMQDLQYEAAKTGEDDDTASNSMCTFLGMNTAGFQLIPASVIAILLASVADNPTQIILPTLIVTSIAFISAIIISKLLAPFFKSKGQESYNGMGLRIKNSSRKNKFKKGLKKLKISAENDIFKEISKKENKFKKHKKPLNDRRKGDLL